LLLKVAIDSLNIQKKPGRVTVPGKLSDDLTPGTQNSILKQASLKK
jgi:predicted RNA binding protein YcfA (HicA-like mRNA interferase family)